MSLIKCRECGKNLSDKAKTCIHCGCLVKKKNTKNNNFWIIVISLIVVIISAIILFMNLFIKKQIPGIYKNAKDEIIQLNDDGSCNIVFWVSDGRGDTWKESSTSCSYEFKRMHVEISYSDSVITLNEKYYFNKTFDKLEDLEYGFIYYKQ